MDATPPHHRRPATWLRAAAFSWAALAAGCAPGYRLPPAWVPRAPDIARWPDAGAIALDDVTELRFVLAKLRADRGEQLVAVEDRHLKIKILREEGLVEAHFRLPIDAYSTVTKVVARSIAPDGQMHNMSVNAPVARVRGRACERAPELKILDFTVPGARVGGVVEVRYERVHVDPLLVPPHVFATHLPAVRSEYAVVVPPDARVDYRFGRGDALVDAAPMHSEATGEGERLVFVEQDVAPSFQEPAMAHPSRNAPWLIVGLRDAPTTKHPHRHRPRPKTLRTWADVAEILRPQMAGVGAEALGAGQGIQGILESYREHVRPLCLPGMGVRDAQTPERIWRGTPTSSRDATGLLAAMLRNSGLKASPALAVTHGGPPVFDDFVAISPFTQGVVAVKMTPEMFADQACEGSPLTRGPLCGQAPGDVLFIDPLCLTCPLGTRPPALGEGRAMIISPDRHGWQPITPDPPHRNLTIWNGTWQMDALGALTGQVEARVRGTGALALRDRYAEGPSAGAWRAALAAMLFGPGPVERSRNEQASGVENPESFVGVTAEVQGQATRLAPERYTVAARVLGGDPLPLAWRGGARRTTALLSPSWHETTVQVELPPGYRANLPPPLKLATPAGEFAAGFSLRGQTLRYARRLVVKRATVAASDWGDFTDFVQAVDGYESRPVPVFARDN